MSVRKLKPVTPAQRFRVVNGFDAITTDKPEKSLLEPKKRSGGRNNKGKMTARHIGGGHKKRYRVNMGPHEAVHRAVGGRGRRLCVIGGVPGEVPCGGVSDGGRRALRRELGFGEGVAEVIRVSLVWIVLPCHDCRYRAGLQIGRF